MPFADDAVRLRRWDDLAKIPGAPTKSLGDYRAAIERVMAAHPPGGERAEATPRDRQGAARWRREF